METLGAVCRIPHRAPRRHQRHRARPLALLGRDRRALIVASGIVSWIVDPCSRNRTVGSFGRFDEFANNIVAAGVVVAFL